VLEPPEPDVKVGPLFAGWSQGEVEQLRSLWLGSLQPLPPDPSNGVGDDLLAVTLGHSLFFDSRFSRDGDVSCATCHQPDLFFTDGLPQAEAIGTTHRGTQAIAGAAYSSWFFWDGRRDSLWSQAMVPLESAIEHGGTRTQFAHLIGEDQSYRELYEKIFAPLPDFSNRDRFPDAAGPVEDPTALAAWESMTPEDQATVTGVFVNLVKAIAAYERRIMPGPSRFDEYVSALVKEDEAAVEALLSDEEVAGMRLFLTRGNCLQCHNGPLFTNNGFHSVGVPDVDESEPDIGRFAGAAEVVDSEFNCLGPYSDADPEQCEELRFVKTEGLELLGAFKVPSLRNVAETAPYMHAGQFESLTDALVHYNSAPLGPTGHTDLMPLGFTAEELNQLEAFLRTLSGPLDVPPKLLSSP
jgi:cytochrome c peroxidase